MDQTIIRDMVYWEIMTIMVTYKRNSTIPIIRGTGICLVAITRSKNQRLFPISSSLCSIPESMVS